MKLSGKDTKVDVEFERSVADEPKGESGNEELDRERHYGGDPAADQVTDVQPDKEKAEWERRYGTEESRDKLGFDGN